MGEEQEMTAIAATGPAEEADHMETMRAAVRTRWGSPAEVVELTRIPKPEPADDQVLVRVRATSINRADYYGVAAPMILLRPMLGGFLKPKSPLLGADFSGVVEAVGKDATGVAPGDEVFGVRTGAFAEYVATRNVARKPPNVSFEEAAAVGIGGLTALQALRNHGALKPGDRVLVNGASGAVGTFAVQLAKALGAAHVTAVCSTGKVEQARRLGADRVIDYTKEDFTQTGDRYDVVVDIAGSKPFRRLRRILAAGGRLVMVGSQVRWSRWIGPMGYVLRTWLAARLARQRAVFFMADVERQDLELLGELLEAGTVKAEVERVYPFAEIAEALRVMGDGHARAKLVVTI
jgi:NADPH:quinone reductase-like Zn-dependent oxidoreductase